MLLDGHHIVYDAAVDYFQVNFDQNLNVSSLQQIFISSRAIRYKQKFLTKNRYDNKYLSKQLTEFDAKRKTLQLETALPLRSKEKAKYVKVSCTVYALYALDRITNSQRSTLYQSKFYFTAECIQKNLIEIIKKNLAHQLETSQNRTISNSKTSILPV